MRTPGVFIVLPCMAALAFACAFGLHVQAQPGPESPDKTSNKKVFEAKGEAKVSLHRVKMDKGAIYRITAKGDGFTPEVRIDGGTGTGGPPGQGSSPLVVRGKAEPAQLIFSPTETKEYRIIVDFVPRSDIGKGPHAYTLTVEKAQFKPHTSAADAELSVSENTHKFELGKAYAIAVTGRGFEPDVQIVDGGKSKQTAFNNGKALGFGPDAEYITNLTFMPSKTAEYRILVAVGPYSKYRAGPLAYTTAISELKPDLLVNGSLTAKDPPYARRGGPHKIHTVKLLANKKYQIDMMSVGFDTYLFLEDSLGAYLMEDDDGGEGLNARIVFTPTKTDTYRVVATTFDRGSPLAKLGDYTVIVMENPNAQRRTPTFKK